MPAILLFFGTALGRQVLMAVGIAIAVGAGYFFLTGVGYSKAEAHYKPLLAMCDSKRTAAEGANTTLASDLKKIVAAYGEQAQAVDQLKAEHAAAIKQKNQALARLIQKQITLRARIDELSAIANGPAAANQQEACDAATAILDDLAAHRQLRK